VLAALLIFGTSLPSSFQQDEAENLYKHCQRYDLLNLFYQATGQWGKVRFACVRFATLLPCKVPFAHTAVDALVLFISLFYVKSKRLVDDFMQQK